LQKYVPLLCKVDYEVFSIVYISQINSPF
jgi:hypothetical protein